MSSQYWYTLNGQRLGPVSGGQLKELVAAGKLSRTDSICRDGKTTWVPAGSVKGLFADDPVAVAVEDAGPSFHYRQKGQQSGPISWPELKRLAANGRLRPEDFVWQDGTPDWVPAGRVEGLFAGRRCLVNGVSFLHPPEWTVTVKTVNDKRDFLNFTIENDLVALTLSVVPGKLVSPDESIEFYREPLQKSETMKKFTATRSTTTIAGEKAEGIDFTCRIQTMSFAGRLHAARVGTRTVTLFWQASEERFDSILAIASLLRSSLTTDQV